MKIAHLDVDSISPPDVYKLLTNVVMPRPIAWVTSRNVNGKINLAPYSFFNAFGAFPPIVAIGVGNESDGLPKHTGRNILREKEFVVNLVTPDLIDQTTISAADFPEGESELDAAGLHAVSSTKITVPRLGEARVSLECVLHSHQRIGANNLIVGQVLAFNIDETLLGPRMHINGFAPLGRMGSPSNYCRTDEQFEYPRVSYAQLRSKKQG